MRKIVLVIMIAAAVGALIVIHGGSKSQQLPAGSSPAQTPLQIDNSGAQLQASGVDIQSALTSGSPVNPESNGQTSAQPTSSSSTPAQPSAVSPTQPKYPPCNSCTLAAGKVCPQPASSASCFPPCGAKPSNNSACLEQ